MWVALPATGAASAATTWTPDTPGKPAAGDNLFAVSCVSTGTCTAVGEIASPIGVTTSSLAEQG